MAAPAGSAPARWRDASADRERLARAVHRASPRRCATGLPVVGWDERLTTVQAERVLIAGDVRRARRREVIDQVAAVILLQSYLDARRETAGA